MTDRLLSVIREFLRREAVEVEAITYFRAKPHVQRDTHLFRKGLRKRRRRKRKRKERRFTGANVTITTGSRVLTFREVGCRSNDPSRMDSTWTRGRGHGWTRLFFFFFLFIID